MNQHHQGQNHPQTTHASPITTAASPINQGLPQHPAAAPELVPQALSQAVEQLRQLLLLHRRPSLDSARLPAVCLRGPERQSGGAHGGGDGEGTGAGGWLVELVDDGG